MSKAARVKFFLAVVVVGLPLRVFAQPDTAPNYQPNPYRTIENWAKLPEGRSWGSTSAVDIAHAMMDTVSRLS